MRYNNQKGMTLVQVLVIVPIGLLMMFALSVALQDLHKSFQSFQAKNESMIAQDILRDLIQNSPSCSNHLRANTRIYNPSTAQNGIMNLSFSLDNGSVLETGADLKEYRVHINSLTFRLFSDGANFMDDLLLPGNKLQYGMAVIETSKMTSGPMIRNAPTVISGLVLSVDSQNKISRCFLLDDSYKLCAHVGGRLYNDGTKDYCFASTPCNGQLLAGFDAAGNPQCMTFSSLVGKRCPANQFLVSNGSGDATCTSPGGGSSAPPPPQPLTCAHVANNPDPSYGPGLSVLGTGSGQPGCFYNQYGVIAYVYLDPTTKTLSMGGGSASDPNFPLSGFTVSNGPTGSIVSAPNGASITYP